MTPIHVVRWPAQYEGGDCDHVICLLIIDTNHMCEMNAVGRARRSALIRSMILRNQNFKPPKSHQIFSKARLVQGDLFRSNQLKSCEFCFQRDRLHCLLLCDGCDRAFHLFCLVPPLAVVPDADWFCPLCLLPGLKTCRLIKKRF